MSTVNSPAPQLIPFSHFEQLRMGREVIRQESEALMGVARLLDATFCTASDLIGATTGHVVVTGLGKAGLIGQKIAATMSSTGTPATFLHPTEAVHGDLGCLHSGDVLLALSNSGETEEVCDLIPLVHRLGVRTIAITATEQSTLGSTCELVLTLGRLREACPWGLAPTTSTTAMLAIGDALALVASHARGFTPHQFATFHPGGSLGRRLKPVGDLMRPRDQLRIAHQSATVRAVLTGSARPGRRSGAVLLVDDEGQLTGIFTDSDLARLLESRQDEVLDGPVSAVMTARPTTVSRNATFGDVLGVLSERKISEVPVVDAAGCPVGLIDITDVIGWMPADQVD
ncbi:MAG: KpsF/GutQ family sugar-phosphate isomerase [Planctomycetaceae bacterium]|nr:KpsF/GutQ family sugar-phosphate isomerase [Planctomycetaceae bacterium]